MPVPNWEKAPADATHYFVGSQGTCAHWLREGADGQWHETYGVDGTQWFRLPRKRPEVYTVPRPGGVQPHVPSDATHTRNRDGRFFKAGPQLHARLWRTYNNLPAWICTSGTTNTDLDDPERFTPITPQQPTTQLMEFTMSADQAKQLALDKRPMKVVTVRFQCDEQAKLYHYFAPADAKAGDFAIVYANKNIVNSPASGFPFTVVEIVNDEVLDTGNATKAILGTFNEDFAKHVQARIEHMARVKAQLMAKKKQFEESAIFEMLATKDPEAAALLNELKSFNL